jgi:hypothetical protein
MTRYSYAAAEIDRKTSSAQRRHIQAELPVFLFMQQKDCPSRIWRRKFRMDQVGVTTVGEVRAVGGDVLRTSGRSPHHATLTGLTSEQASNLLTPTIKNPA